MSNINKGYLINRRREIKQKGKVKYLFTGWVSKRILINSLLFFVIRNIVKYFAASDAYNLANEMRMFILVICLVGILIPIGGYLEWDLQTNLLKIKNKAQDKKIKKRFILTYGIVLWGLPIFIVNTLSANYLGNSNLVLVIQLFIDAILFLSMGLLVGNYLYKKKRNEYLS